MTAKEALTANLERARDAIDRERAKRGIAEMGIKKPLMLSPELEEAYGHLCFVINNQIHTLKITEARKPKLSAQSHWLLNHLARVERISRTAPLSAHWSQQPKMPQMRGLIRRGWAKEEMNGGLFVITRKGKEAAALVGPPPPVAAHLQSH